MDHWHFSILKSGTQQNFKLMIDIWILELVSYGGVNMKVLRSDNFCPSECSF